MFAHPLFTALDNASSNSDRDRNSDNSTEQRTLYLDRLRCDMQIGAYASEKGRRQPVEVRVAVRVSRPAQPIADRLDQVLDYNCLRDIVLALVNGPHVHLQETLCDLIAEHCLALPGVQACYVAVAKTQAFGDCDAVGCEVLRRRAT